MSRATYVYCVVHGGKPLRVPKKGLSGTGAPRAVALDDGYRIVLADAPLALYSAEAIEAKLQDLDWVSARAAEHEAVVEDAARTRTVVPMKLFTLFASEERAVEHVRKMRRSLDKVVARIEGCDEWGLRVLFDEARANAERAKAKAARPASGTGFLMRKKQLDDERRVVAAVASEQVDALYDRLAKASRRALRRPPVNREIAGRVLLDAVFLVKREGARKFKAAVASKAKELVKGGFAVTLTGPWPAYSFIGGT